MKTTILQSSAYKNHRQQHTSLLLCLMILTFHPYHKMEPQNSISINLLLSILISQESTNTIMILHHFGNHTNGNAPKLRSTKLHNILIALKRCKFLKQEDWKLWETSEWLQLDQYKRQNMFGNPVPIQPDQYLFNTVWIYLVKKGRSKTKKGTLYL